MYAAHVCNAGLVYYNQPQDSWGSELKQASGIAPMLVGTIFLFLHQDTMRPHVEHFEARVSAEWQDLRERGLSVLVSPKSPRTTMMSPEFEEPLYERIQEGGQHQTPMTALA